MEETRSAVSLEAIAERLDRVEGMLSRFEHALAQVLDVAAMVTDMADEAAARSVAAGVLPEERVRDAVELLGQLGQALSSTRGERPGRAGLLAMLRASREPDVQRTLDFTVRFLRHLGGCLDADERLAMEPTARKELSHV